MVKSLPNPSRSMSRRRIRTQAEWKVEAHTSLASGPSRAASRSFSSPAALLVKVMAMISQGRGTSTAQSFRARRASSSAGRAGKLSRNRRSSSVAQSGTSSESLPRP